MQLSYFDLSFTSVLKLYFIKIIVLQFFFLQYITIYYDLISIESNSQVVLCTTVVYLMCNDIDTTTIIITGGFISKNKIT